MVSIIHIKKMKDIKEKLKRKDEIIKELVYLDDYISTPFIYIGKVKLKKWDEQEIKEVINKRNKLINELEEIEDYLNKEDIF